jgi:hypothetical protein
MFWKYFDFTLLLYFYLNNTWESNTANKTIYNTCCTTKSALNNTKHSYLSKTTQWEIFQKLINLLLNMHIHSYTIWSYVYTSHSQWKISRIFFFSTKKKNAIKKPFPSKRWWLGALARHSELWSEWVNCEEKKLK